MKQAFSLTFARYTELSGLPWAKLFASCNESDDMDIHVMIRKHGVTGKLLEHANYSMPVPIQQVPNANVPKYQGTNGMARASLQVSLEPKTHPDDYPVLRNDKAEKIQPGETIPVEIPIWPIGMTFGPGEGITVIISGHDLKLPEVIPPFPVSLALKMCNDENRGTHRIHSGGDVASFVMIPFITSYAGKDSVIL